MKSKKKLSVIAVDHSTTCLSNVLRTAILTINKPGEIKYELNEEFVIVSAMVNSGTTMADQPSFEFRIKSVTDYELKIDRFTILNIQASKIPEELQKNLFKTKISFKQFQELKKIAR